MSNNIFPELDGWDEISLKAPNKDALSSIKTIHKLVLSLANLRSAVSSQVGYLQNKIERLQQSVDFLSSNLKSSIDDFNCASSKLYRVNIWLTGVIAFATIAGVIVNIDLGLTGWSTLGIISIIGLILFFVARKISV